MADDGTNTVTIPQAEYDAMLRDLRFLNALRACGVDSWEGYADAIEMLEDD